MPGQVYKVIIIGAGPAGLSDSCAGKSPEYLLPEKG
jgi:cation diffusion facilitator CzcD-associated flavoprotein CzcO